jgi:transposase
MGRIKHAAYSDDVKHAAIKLARQGELDEAIATKLGINSSETVAIWRRSVGIKRKPGVGNKIDFTNKRWIAASYVRDYGMPRWKAAKLVALKEPTVTNAIRKAREEGIDFPKAPPPPGVSQTDETDGVAS